MNISVLMLNISIRDSIFYKLSFEEAAVSTELIAYLFLLGVMTTDKDKAISEILKRSEAVYYNDVTKACDLYGKLISVEQQLQTIKILIK